MALNETQQSKITNLITALDARYIQESELSKSNVVMKSETAGLLKNDGTVDTNTYLTQHQDISGKEDSSNKSTSITTDTGSTTKYPTVKAVEDYAQAKGNYIETSNTAGLVKNDGTIDSNSYLTTGTAQSTYVAKDGDKVLSDNNFTDAYKTTLDGLSTDMSGKTVTLEEKTTPTTGYLKTYDIKQGGTSIGVIDIPKDLVVTQGTLVTNPAGQTAGKYLELTIANQNEKVYINVADLAHIYSADNSTLQVSNDTFSIKNGGVGTTQIANSSVTTGKLDAGVATQWKSDADTEIEAYLTALTSALTPSS